MNNWDVNWGAWYPDPPEAQTAEAQTAAALETYRKMGVTYVEVSTAGDDNVCEACRAAEAYGSYPIDRPPALPLCAGCRCALLPVPGANRLR
jgi:hypothetical protein